MWGDYDDIWDWNPHQPTREIIVEDKEKFTGLYNHKGEPLYRPHQPIGFDLKRKNNDRRNY